MNARSVVLALALATGAHAGYENTTFGYTLELPAGWQAQSKPDATAAMFAHAETGQSVRVSGAVRGGALGAPEIERLKASDEAALKKRIAQYKTAPFSTPAQIAGCSASHYGFVYRDEKSQVMISRFAAFTRSRGTDHVWMKVNAVFPKGALATATPALEKLLAGLRWKEAAPPPAVVESPPPARPDVATVVDTTPQPKVDIPTTTDGATDLSSLMTPMSKKDGERFENSFKPSSQPRTAEEQARAREMGLGGTFSPGR